jgi:cytochrome d ubiquinol oxidase subunit I
VQFPHTVLAGFTTAAFFVMGISAYHLLRKNEVDLFRRSFQIAAMIGAISIVLVVLNGHSQTQHLVETQPMKMASAEALYNTESPASFSILTIGDLSQREEVFAIRIPRLLCLLSYNQLECEIKGINDLQKEYEATFGAGNYIPPVAITYWSFRIMVGAGFLLLGLALYALFMVMGDMVTTRQRTLRLYLYAIALPYIANTAGWVLTEVGRFPWIVYGLMRIEKGVSTMVGAGTVAISLVGFSLIYAALIVANVYLMVKYARIVPGPSEAGSLPEAGEPLPSLVGAQD